MTRPAAKASPVGRLPRVMLWWGIVLIVCGGALIVFVPWYPDWLLSIIDGERDQTLRLIAEVLVRVLREIIPPLGCVLVAAAIVMRFVDRCAPARG